MGEGRTGSGDDVITASGSVSLCSHLIWHRFIVDPPPPLLLVERRLFQALRLSGLAQCLSQLERVKPYQAACDIALSIVCKGDASCRLYGGVTAAFVERNGVLTSSVGGNESLSDVFSVKVINGTL